MNSPRAAAEESSIAINWYFTYTCTGAMGSHSVNSGQANIWMRLGHSEALPLKTFLYIAQIINSSWCDG